MKAFTEDLEACWAYLRCPALHHKRIRTTNLLERAFVEQKRRTKIIPRFPGLAVQPALRPVQGTGWTEKSCLKLVFASLWQTSQRWQGVRMSEIEQHQLQELRTELGVLPPGSSGEALRRAA